MNLDVDPATLQRAAEAACRVGLRAGLVESDARDLAQEALVRALTSSRPPPGVSLLAWVYGIARNLGRDHAKSARRREVPVAELPEIAAEQDVAAVLAVRHALEELPDLLRDIVTLHELEEHSLRETAELLQIPFDTAKDRLRRARAQLRDRLADSDEVLARERTHTRRRAAACGAAIVAAVHATVHGTSSAAAAATATGSSAAAAAGPASGSSAAMSGIPAWIAAIAGSLLVAGGFVAGRFTAEPEAEAPPLTATSSNDEPIPTAVVVAADVAPIPAPGAFPSLPSVASPPGRASGLARATRAEVVDAGATVVGASSEALLVDRARTALSRLMHEEALVTLMAHGRQFPTGVLAEERDVLIIEAYLRAGNHELARRRVERYRAEHEHGVLGARVDTLAKEIAP